MKQVARVRGYVSERRDAITTVVILTAIVVSVCGIVLFFVQSSRPNIVYQPTIACKKFDSPKAKAVLGDAALKTIDEEPSIVRDVAISKCGYTNGNPDMSRVVVAAMIVRTGINDEGSAKNKSEFTTNIATPGVQEVKNLADKAYFNTQKGQLNILEGHDWLVISYGVANDPQANTLDKSVELARKILR